VQADYGKKSECISDHKLAALTFGSYILCSRIFRFAQQLVHIRQNNSFVVSSQFVGFNFFNFSIYVILFLLFLI
jgi:hypothetical protein